MLRSLLLASVTLAIATPSADAALADRYVPYLGAADGVTVRAGAVRFDRKAAKFYQRWFAGRVVDEACTTIESDGDTVTGGLTGSTPYKASRTRRVLPISGGQVCSLATPRRRSDRFCLAMDRSAPQQSCVRLIVALDDTGRVRVDAFQRELELSVVFAERNPYRLGTDIVSLPAAGASPPAGKVGVWQPDAETRTVAVLDGAGTRWFVGYERGVFTTNVAGFVSIGSLTIP